MNKSFMGVILSIALIFPFTCAFAAQVQEPVKANPAGSPVAQFTGHYWVKSTPTEKEAFLFGVDTAISIEYFISDKAKQGGKDRKKGMYTLSPFEKGWMEAFTNYSRKEIIKDVDDWYAAHPDQLDRPVMDVIWYDVVEPRLKALNK